MTRLFVPITYPFSVRYLLHTGLLEALASHCDVVTGLTWSDPSLESELDTVCSEVVQLPRAEFSAEYKRLRRLLDFHYWRRLQSPSFAIDRRRRLTLASPRSRALLRARQLRQTWQLSKTDAELRLNAAFAKLCRTGTNIDAFEGLLASKQIDAVLTPTPYHAAEEPLLVAASGRGLRLVTAIISFDNVTTRGWIPVLFDRYLVWNHYNRSELLRGYPQVNEQSIDVVGAPQFDFYYQPGRFWSETEWRERLGIERNRPVILFGAGPPQIVPNEPQYVAMLDDAIERKAIRDRPLLLVRRHPIDSPDRWADVVRSSRHVVYDDPWPIRGRPEQSAPDNDAIARLCSTLRHSSVHMSTSSTMTVDGAVVDRPQVSPAFSLDRRFDRMIKELYIREHWLPIARSGAVDSAGGPQELASAVDRALAEPTTHAAERAAMVLDVTGFDDGRSTQRVVQSVLDALEQ